MVNFTVETGETKIIIELPPEEQLESAAARVRPLILQDELTYHAKVMNALLYSGNASNPPEAAIEALRTLKKEWAAINSKGMTRAYYSVMIQEGDGEISTLNDGSLAFAWIYGDVVHADPERRQAGQVFGVEERYRAAVPMVVRLMVLAMYTLRIIEGMTEIGVIPDLGDVFKEEVAVKRTVIELKAQVHVAEYDEDGNLPKPPAMDEKYSAEWKPFAEVFTPGPSDNPSNSSRKP